MLILQAERDALLKPLLAVTGIVERRHTLPILSNVLLESVHGQTNILATDLEIHIMPMPCCITPPTPTSSPSA